jgi:hypothetical protein
LTGLDTIPTREAVVLRRFFARKLDDADVPEEATLSEWEGKNPSATS